MKYFTLNELIKSDTATKYGIKNEPNEAQKENLRQLIVQKLDPAREALGMEIIVTSGYRGDELNKRVGGSKSSQHKDGYAVDVYCADLPKLHSIFEAQGNFDQLIKEKWSTGKGWIHISFVWNGRNRNQKLIIN